MFQDYVPPHNNIAYSLFWIFNPVSGEKYKLPPLPYTPITAPCMRVAFSSALDSENFLGVIWSLNEDDSIPRLSFCRLSDESWTRIETNKTHFKDIMRFESELYAVNAHSVTIFNLKYLNAITSQRLIVQLPKLDEPICRLARDPTHGEIMLVLFTSKEYQIKDIHIFKLDMNDPKWIEIDSLNGCVLFVDRLGLQVVSIANLEAPPEFMEDNFFFLALSIRITSY